MDINFAPASGHKPQQRQAMAFDLYNRPTTFQWLWMQRSVRSYLSWPVHYTWLIPWAM